MSSMEQTLSIIKPDAVERNLTDKIKTIFTENNLKIKETLTKLLWKIHFPFRKIWNYYG